MKVQSTLNMKHILTKKLSLTPIQACGRLIPLALLLGGGLTALAEPGNDNRAPEVPGDIAVEPGNKVHFHGFGVGFQVYTWNGTDWGRAVPDALLFNGQGAVVATHFGVPIPPLVHPAWQSNSGSIVVGGLPPAAGIVD